MIVKGSSNIARVPSPDYDKYATPTLMRAARGAYAQAMRAALVAAGFEDLPRNGAFILAGTDGRGGTLDDLPEGLGVTKQAVSQTVEVLVNRGYLERRTDPEDRRRNLLEPTKRGREVVATVVAALEEIDHQLAEHVDAEEYAAMRKALAAMAQVKVTRLEAGTSRRRKAPLVERCSPIFPVRDLEPALEHYRLLGFKVAVYDAAGDYGFADRDGVGLHLMAVAGQGQGQGFGRCYFYVRDADALFEEWTRPGVPGTTLPPAPTPYKLKEGRHEDPDGNVIRFGSWLGNVGDEG